MFGKTTVESLTTEILKSGKASIGDLAAKRDELVGMLGASQANKDSFIKTVGDETSRIISGGDKTKQASFFKLMGSVLLVIPLSTALSDGDGAFIPLAVDLLNKTDVSHDLCLQLCTAIWYFIYYASPARRFHYSRFETGVVASCFQVLKNQSTPMPTMESAAAVLNNLAINADSAMNMLHPSMNMIEYMFELAIKHHDVTIGGHLVGIVKFLAKTHDEAVVRQLVDMNVHVKTLEYIKKGGAKTSEWTGTKRVLDWLLMATFIAMFDFGATALKDAGAVEILAPIMAEGSNAAGYRIQVMYCLSFIVGKQEGQGNTLIAIDAALVAEFNKVCNQILVQDGPFANGTYTLFLLVRNYLVMSTSDTNKDLLVATPDCLNHLKTILELYLNDKPDIKFCGGGGKDHKVAAAAIECMLSLSFAFDDDEELRNGYMKPSTGIIDLLTALASKEALPLEAHKHRNMLLSRLIKKEIKSEPKQEPVQAAVVTNTANNTTTATNSNTAVQQSVQSAVQDNSPPVKRTHVMISYCWRKDCQPENVITLANQLGHLGYEIWRDEVGSALVPKMEGETDDRMAEALEASSHVIICVSKGYKESANCRMEAKYANQLFKKKRITIIYAMMNDTYTTVSEPECCDGWLGIMLGDSLWYPLFTQEKALTAADNIASLLGAHSRKGAAAAGTTGGNGGNSQPSSPTKAVTQSVSKVEITAPAGIDYVAAYEFLNNDKNCTPDNYAKLQDFVTNELGLSAAEDMAVLEAEHIIQMAKLMKIVPKTRFAAMMNVALV